MASHLNLLDETLASMPGGQRTATLPRHDSWSLRGQAYQTRIINPHRDTLGVFSKSSQNFPAGRYSIFYMPKVGDTLSTRDLLGGNSARSSFDLSDGNIKRLYQQAGGYRHDLAAKTEEFRQHADDVRKSFGVPKELNEAIAQRTQDLPLVNGHKPTIVLNHFRAPDELINFKTHTNKLHLMAGPKIDEALHIADPIERRKIFGSGKGGFWKAGGITTTSFDFTPPIHAQVAKDLSTIQRTALFERDFARSAKFARGLSKTLAGFKLASPFIITAAIGSTAFYSGTRVWNVYQQEGRFGWNTLRASGDAAVDIVDMSLNPDFTGTSSAYAKTALQNRITELQRNNTRELFA